MRLSSEIAGETVAGVRHFPRHIDGHARPPPTTEDRVQHRPPVGSNRGRRRAPTPPRSRYAAVVTPAVVGAGVVALGASAGLPDLKAAGYASSDTLTPTSLASDLAERQKTVADRASRSND